MRDVSGNIALLLEFFSGKASSFYNDKRGQMTQHSVLQVLPHTGTEPDTSFHPALIGVGAGSLQSPAKAPSVGLLNNW